jgi:CapZ-interacting protein
MSILDDAIREHLELKRAHGADEAEVKRLEDEAFGPPGRPDDADPFAEAPTEFLGAAVDVKEGSEEADGRRVPNIADLQEAPPPPKPAETAEDAAPADEDQPAMEHQTIPVPHPEAEAPAPGVDAGPSTEEREAIADQPTEFFDVEAEMEAGAEQRSPTDEQLLDSQLSEPRLAPEPTPAEPLEAVRDTGPDAEVAREDDLDDEDDDFFSEQRLSDELNQALEAPVTDEHETYDAEEEESGEHESHEDVYEPETGSHDDVLEDTPEFLEDAPDDDDLWFEQKPPKDFDLD